MKTERSPGSPEESRCRIKPNKTTDNSDTSLGIMESEMQSPSSEKKDEITTPDSQEAKKRGTKSSRKSRTLFSSLFKRKRNHEDVKEKQAEDEQPAEEPPQKRQCVAKLAPPDPDYCSMEYNLSRKNGVFSLPSTWIPQNGEGRQRVVVVSVVGKSTLDAGGCKAASLEAMVGRKIFNRDMIQTLDLDPNTMVGVEGYFDHRARVIYLHLTAAHDTSAIISALTNMHSQLQEKGFLMAWSSLKLGYARSLLLLFSVSHLLLLCHPSHTFDITYIHLFRTLDAIRCKAQSYLCEVLRGVPGINKDWASFGRLCSPRVLFIFSARLLPKLARANHQHTSSTHPTQASPHRSGTGERWWGGGGSGGGGGLRNLELALEDQIYRLLRKSRVITNISANSLFALPNNQAYVYLMEEGQENQAPPALLKNTLHNLCYTPGADSLVNDLSQLSMRGKGSGGGGMWGGGTQRASPSPDTTTTTPSSPSSTSTSADTLSATILSGVSTERKRNLEHSFNVFLQQHIDQALGKGFDDNVGRHSGPVFFQIPRASVWFEAANRVYRFFVAAPDKDTKAKQVVGSLQSLVETEVRFSDARCAKVLPLAIAAYKEGLPPHYTHLHHQHKVEVAQSVLSGQARGPMYEHYMTQLEDACERIWTDGRQGCETLSLTGNTCTHPRHKTSHDTDDDRPLPVMPHSSGVTYVSGCNCGHRQGQREDPFSARAANLTFYQHLAETCCSRLDSIPFPTFKPSVSNATAAQVELDGEEVDGESDPGTPHHNNTPGGLTALSGGSVISSAAPPQRNMTPPQRMTPGDTTASTGSQLVITLTAEDTKTTSRERGVIRQASTTEYLPGMLHTASPPGLLPQWSSWSLVCLGPSSLYSHNAGICEQPGFLAGTNFLLPWDVTVKVQDREKWPAIADTLGKKALMLKNKKNRGGDGAEFSVKIFLGVEYECVRGHRFMMAGPDRPLKASPSGLVKDNASRVANQDMPLYYPCPCSRGGASINGQLMRIHVVTPKAPVNVTLNPQVQPGPDPCPRYLPQPAVLPPIKLSPSAYWVLRLPSVYVGDQGPHYPPDPRHPAPPAFARLLKGCYGISQLVVDRI
ncbi:hypothetical protein Pmani_016826 [Petrolisthes manimaculis]|uniref:Nonsense-mediated mRNA decay factor SMG8 n=1 Tax=Petrolisthes manimaculis TaxID=1843537 RepID=A0AAE1PPA6_9EUCA|nr:hypothetical protein Pmani_016826 [Petrolisthes manimaculis]